MATFLEVFPHEFQQVTLGVGDVTVLDEHRRLAVIGDQGDFTFPDETVSF